MLELVKAVAGVGAVAWYATSLYVGVRLLVVGVRDDNPPARWIGTYLFFAMGLGSILYMSAMLSPITEGTPMTAFDRVLIGVHLVMAVIANHGLLTFTHRVFRRDSKVAALAARAMLGCMIVGAVGHGLTTDFHGDFVTAWAGVYLVVPVLGNAWAAVESFLYYRLMRKRLALGLADPLIANRFALYGTGAATAAILLGTNLFQMQVVAHLSPASVGGVQFVALVLMGVLGLVCAGAYLFAFFPPTWYARHLDALGSEG